MQYERNPVSPGVSIDAYKLQCIIAAPRDLRRTSHSVNAFMNPLASLPEFLSRHWIAASAFILVVGALIVDFWRGTARNGLSPRQLVKIINDNSAVTLDIRGTSDYDRGHIIDAINIPQPELAKRLAELEKFRERPIVICCHAGDKAAPASKLLTQAGFAKVFLLQGGITAWRQDNLPLAT